MSENEFLSWANIGQSDQSNLCCESKYVMNHNAHVGNGYASFDKFNS